MAEITMPANYADALKRFTSNTEEHEINVLRDDGLYRHLRFQKAGTSIYYFDLVTWPGYLAIVGDAGDYVFSRVTDMFGFFDHGGYGINPDYWSEKLQAPSPDAALTYSYDLYRKRVQEWLDDTLQYGAIDDAESLRRAVKEQLLDDWLEARYSEHGAREALRDFEHNGLRIEDFWEWRLREFDGRFLWCCWAIVKGIERYRSVVPKVDASPETVGPTTRVWTVKVYRDDSTTPVVYEDVKHLFWTADNSVLVIAQFTDGPGQEAHHYIHWPRERVCWYRLARAAPSAPTRPSDPAGGETARFTTKQSPHGERHGD